MPQIIPVLSHEASARATNLQVTSTLPSEVVQTLKNARFLHLATCTANQPHVSLMNYTYLPSTPYSENPTIIMTTNPSSKKTSNLVSNPNVSLLVHDWVSHRPPVTAPSGAREASPEARGTAGRSSLATLLANLNTSALSSISATINGVARLVDRGTEEEEYLKEKHLENNTFGEGESGEALDWGVRESEGGDGGRGCFIEGEEVRVVVVRITDGRVADWKGAVRDWTLSGVQEGGNGRGREGIVNGI